MAGVTDILTGLLDSMQAVATPQASGQSIAATVAPKPGEIDINEILYGEVDITWITKDVVFGTADPEGSLEPAALTSAVTQGLPIGGLNPPVGTAGLLGQLTGSLPLLSSTRLQPTLTVSWTVLDKDKNQLANGEFVVTKGTVVPPNPAVGGADITVAFLPEVVEATTNNPVPEPKLRFLRAHVKLSAAGTAVEKDLPDLPVLVPALAVPKVLAAFVHANFQAKDGDNDGGAFILVPGNSPLRSIEQLKTTLAALQEAVTSLKSFAGFAAFLLGLSELTGALTATPYFAFAAADQVADLNDITLIQRSWYENDTELEDEFSSMILIGPAGKVLDVFCETDFDDENGRFKLTTGPNFFSIIRNMHFDHPPSEPANMVEVLVEPTHSLIDDDNLTFGDWTSSVKFV